MKNKGIFLFISGLTLLASPLSYSESNSNSNTVIKSAPTLPIPGPRTCFWNKGPFSADPYINLAYPDSKAFYWASNFTMPEGSKLELVGDFPHARYMSISSYDINGVPVDTATDYLIKPENGSVNPFIVGNARNSVKRKYSIDILNTPNISKKNLGEIKTAGNVQTLHVPAYGNSQQAIIYRIYAPDKGSDITGGTNLPTPILTLANGQKLTGEQACSKLNSGQRLQANVAAASLTPIEYRKLVQQPDKPNTWPAQNPSQWYILQDRKSLSGIYTGEFSENAQGTMEGFFPNIDNQYIRTVINRKYGKVFVMRGKAPTTPKTLNNDPVMNQGQLRYWSICSTQGFANTRVNDCVFDEEIHLDANGNYTIMVSRPEDRPRNAIPECGISWLPMAKDGDGVIDDDVSVIYLRHMLAAKTFENTISKIKNQKEVAQVLGPYYPKTSYLMTNQAEGFIPCSH